MDGLAEFLLELILEGAAGAAGSRRVPMPVRVLAACAVGLLWFGTGGLVLWCGLATHSAGLAVQGGVRPVLIVQNDIGNRFSPTVIAAAITSKQDKTNLPTHIPVKAGTGGLSRDSVVLFGADPHTGQAPPARKGRARGRRRDAQGGRRVGRELPGCKAACEGAAPPARRPVRRRREKEKGGLFDERR